MKNRNVKMLEVSTTGVKDKVALLTPGDDAAGNDYIDRNSKIHINKVDLVAGGAGVVTIYMSGGGTDKAVFERTFGAAGEIHTDDCDIFVDDNIVRVLGISVSTNITVTGRIFYTVEPIGGKVVKTSGLY